MLTVTLKVPPTLYEPARPEKVIPGVPPPPSPTASRLLATLFKVLLTVWPRNVSAPIATTAISARSSVVLDEGRALFGVCAGPRTQQPGKSTRPGDFRMGSSLLDHLKTPFHGFELHVDEVGARSPCASASAVHQHPGGPASYGVFWMMFPTLFSVLLTGWPRNVREPMATTAIRARRSVVLDEARPCRPLGRQRDRPIVRRSVIVLCGRPFLGGAPTGVVGQRSRPKRGWGKSSRRPVLNRVH